MNSKITLMIAFLWSLCVTNAEATQYPRNSPNRGMVKQTKLTANAGSATNGPVLIRIIKESKSLELWKQKDERFELIKTYNICAMSGHIGPKKKYGDMQAPEGFYEITKNQLNPSSKEYLSFNTGFPNARDKSYGYTGSALMIHGGCRSAGCFAINDDEMEELYAAVRDALNAGQSSVQLQIYPFKMSGFRMLMTRSDPNFAFWYELKQGWDYFEKSHSPIPVIIKDKKYIIAKE